MIAQSLQAYHECVSLNLCHETLPHIVFDYDIAHSVNSIFALAIGGLAAFVIGWLQV